MTAGLPDVATRGPGDAPTDESAQGKLVRAVSPGGLVLDLAVGTGEVARALVARGGRVVGVEVDPDAAKVAATVCEHVVVGDLDRLDLELELGDRRFSTVLAGGVLEDLADPQRVLRAARRLLAPGGHLVASVANVAHGSVRLALLHGDLPRSERGLLARAHRQFLTREAAVAMLREAGFAVLVVDATVVDVADSEVPYPDDALTQAVLAAVESDPEARAYEHVLVAWPDPTTADAGLPGLLSRLDEDLRRARQHAAQWEARGTAAERRSDELEGQVREQVQARLAPLEQELLVAKDQLMHRDHDVRRVVDLFEAQGAALRVAEQDRAGQHQRLLEAHERAQVSQAAAEETRAELEAVRTSRTWTTALRVTRLLAAARGAAR